jgi:hypothetical protein
MECIVCSALQILMPITVFLFHFQSLHFMGCTRTMDLLLIVRYVMQNLRIANLAINQSVWHVNLDFIFRTSITALTLPFPLLSTISNHALTRSDVKSASNPISTTASNVTTPPIKFSTASAQIRAETVSFLTKKSVTTATTFPSTAAQPTVSQSRTTGTVHHRSLAARSVITLERSLCQSFPSRKHSTKTKSPSSCRTTTLLSESGWLSTLLSSKPSSVCECPSLLRASTFTLSIIQSGSSGCRPKSCPRTLSDCCKPHLTHSTMKCTNASRWRSRTLRTDLTLCH